MKRVKIGIIGAGGIFRGAHAPAYRALSDIADVIWVCDKDREVAQGGAGILGAKWTTQLEDILSDEEVDAVDICTPKHRRIDEEAADASKHILCEKPLGFTLEDCDACIDAAKKPG